MSDLLDITCPKCAHQQLTVIQSKSRTDNEIDINCQSCGYMFSEDEEKGLIDDIIIKIYERKGILQSIRFCKRFNNMDLKESKIYVEKLAELRGAVAAKGNCFIATACYGDYNAYEVIILRRYRDEVLLKSGWGKIFVKIYYFLSPGIAILVAKSEPAKAIIRKYFLQPLITRLSPK